ncbi:MAG: SDR family oxidoreductase, partial [Actinobacteria bacterium]|nr:SDR family oxidoreductase [Actinomycetota bacterium]
MLVKSLAIVLAPHGIRINAVLPGAILTDMSGPLLDPGSPTRRYYDERIPLWRPGDPEEIAGPIAYPERLMA